MVGFLPMLSHSAAWSATMVLYVFNMFPFIQEDEDDIWAYMGGFLDVLFGGMF